MTADLILPRRRFLIGLASLIAAPAIVRAGSLMPVRALDDDLWRNNIRIILPPPRWRIINRGAVIRFGDIATAAAWDIHVPDAG